ncbi:MAG: YlbF family regulator [Eubacteriales bacterium]
MLPKKELQELARVLKVMPEYTGMVQQRKKIMSDQRLNRMMISFEREYIWLLNANLPDEDKAARFKKLYLNYKDFLKQEEVTSFIEATHKYQKTISECIHYLNVLLDVSNSGRVY